MKTVKVKKTTPREPLTDVFEGLDRGVPCEEVNPLSTSLAINSDRSDSDWKEPMAAGVGKNFQHHERVVLVTPGAWWAPPPKKIY